MDRNDLFAQRMLLCAVSLTLLSVAVIPIAGCSTDNSDVRQIQKQRQKRQQSLADQDHIGEAFGLLTRLVNLNSSEARRQIAYNLNRWQKDRPSKPAVDVSPTVKTISEFASIDEVTQRVSRETYTATDVDHLRDSYLCRQMVQWIDLPAMDDPLLESWFESAESDIGADATGKLRTCSRLFDWVVRNVSNEPLTPNTAAPPAPPMSSGLAFRGAGYRQTDYQTLWRGTGDGWQQASLFILLARQADVDAFVVSIPDDESGKLVDWCVGTLINDQIYLFEPVLGIPIPGPEQVGIATLNQARSDASVLRRLKVPGFFDYPFSKGDVAQCIARLSVVPEAISGRMKHLESGLTGDRRMTTFVSVDQLAERVDQVRGIAGVRLWPKPLQSEAYKRDMENAASRDPAFQFWYLSRWATLEASIGSSEQLALARWRHLHGQFNSDDEESEKGARVLYLTQRAPEFEIADLRIDVELQKAYGIRRKLGTSAQVYDQQVQQVQAMMRMGKQTATYWISQIQYDDERYDTAESWFTKRVLGDGIPSMWDIPATYNLARTLERLERVDEAIQLYKSDQNPRSHGGRIRARQLSKMQTEK